MIPKSTNKPLPRHHAGFILPFALAVTAVSAITAVTLISYCNNFSRYAHRASAKNRCRLAAQSVIEQTKIAIQNRFATEAPPLMRSDPMMVSVFCDWFATLNNSASTNTTCSVQGGLEEGGHTIKSPVKTDGCVVYVGILPNTATTNATEAILPITATAELTLPDKQRVSVTVLEQVRFYAGQNQVFNYAYFANNYGWMEANGATSDAFFINGDFRANGNISIDGSTVNGFIYAAANPAIGAPEGKASVSAHYWGASYYRSYAQNSQNGMVTMRPTDPVKDGGDSWIGGYDAPKNDNVSTHGIYTSNSANHTTTRGATSNAPIVNQGTDPIEMPMISDLEGYVKYAQQQKGTLKCPQYTFKDSTATQKTVKEKNVNAYYNDVGPSGDANLADKGALVLVGTSEKPIIINGPVVVDSDVIIKGVIKGQGVIYAGRNIHVLGSITYANGPSWANINNGINSVTNNINKDLVCFIAKGNVVLGDCSSTSWLNDISKYITPKDKTYNTSQHDCDPSDENIGYAEHFDGDYTKTEAKGLKEKVRLARNQYVETGTDWRGNKTYGYRDILQTKRDRKYYETVCDDALLTSLSSTINKLDGVFYNNHCIMGKMGDSTTKVAIFGSLVCRNEAIQVNTKGGMFFNWDNRLREGSPSHVAGLPLPRGLQTPHTYTWQEVPDEMNPIYKSQSNALNEL